MKGDPKVIDVLNRALRSELTAINQYWLHARLQSDWGYGKLAAKSQEETAEERAHAEKIMDRIIFLDGAPDMQTLDPVRTGATVKETLEADLAAEHDAHALYTEARDVCRAARDYVSMAIFEDLLADEEGHIDDLETQLDLLGRIGAENYGLLNATSADEAA